MISGHVLNDIKKFIESEQNWTLTCLQWQGTDPWFNCNSEGDAKTLCFLSCDTLVVVEEKST